jgi:hypothetical protein
VEDRAGFCESDSDGRSCALVALRVRRGSGMETSLLTVRGVRWRTPRLTKSGETQSMTVSRLPIFSKTDSSGFVVFPTRVLHNRLALPTPNAPQAHIFLCLQAEYGDALFDKQNPKMASELRLRKGYCPYGWVRGRTFGENTICFLFAFWVGLCLKVFNRCPMPRKQLAVLSCIEHERLEFELIEVRTRGAIPDPASQAVARRAGGLGPAGAAGAFASRGSRTGAWVQRLKS